MRVLYFMNHADQGGAALALYDLVSEIKNNPQITPVVITGKNNKLNKMLTDIGVENYVAPFKNFTSSRKEPVLVYRFFLRIRYRIGLFIALRKIEKIIDLESIDIIHSNLNRIDIGVILAKKYKIPHVWHIREHADGRDFTLVSVKKDPIAYMNSFDSYYVAISESVKNAWRSKGINEKKEVVIYDGIREELYNPSTDKDNQKLRIIFLGGYAKSKGQEELIDALSSLPNNMKNKLEVDLYGNGSRSYVEFLQDKAIKNGVNRFMRFHSYVDDIWKQIPKYDVGLTCSRVEGFGRVTVEYMAAGLCPIASNGGATPEIVKHNENGILYDVGNKEDLRDAILWAINNRDRVSQMGIEASQYVRKYFTMKEHTRKMIQLYNYILAERKDG